MLQTNSLQQIKLVSRMALRQKRDSTWQQVEEDEPTGGIISSHKQKLDQTRRTGLSNSNFSKDFSKKVFRFSFELFDRGLPE